MPQTAPGTQAYTQAAPPQGYYAYPPPQKKGGDTPGWVLVGVGVALAVGAGKVMEFVGGKKGDMQSMMLQQMMKQMGNQAGGGAPGGMPGMGGRPCPVWEVCPVCQACPELREPRRRARAGSPRSPLPTSEPRRPSPRLPPVPWT